jgi:prefoldin subunit 5
MTAKEGGGMSEQARGRLEELRHEYEVGQRRLQELMAQEVAIRETLLRISGAIQVLEELTGDEPQPSPATSVPGAGVPAEPSPPGSVLTVG